MTIEKILLKYAILLFLPCIVAKADTSLVIGAEASPGKYTCWAAATDMMQIYYGNKSELNKIASR